MTTLTCIIVDDEPIARDILKQYIIRDERLMLEASYSNAADALREINVIKPVLMFLDIKMPKISGFELIRSMPQHPYVIFTTAYREFALDGFDLNAVDYLLKPFSFERFLQAVNKAYTLIIAEKGEKFQSASLEDEKDMFVKADGKLVRVRLQDILYIEALKEYVRIYTTEGNWVIYQTMQNLEDNLPNELFFRIHRSYIVALRHIKSIEGNTVQVNKMTLPVSRYTKDAFMEKIARYKLIR
ncbi:MAG: response regulator transcription factor [Chitinophagaceae bacterium]|nr:response regulator transcription factor [Chitinophagaceae bacterium]